MYSKNNLEELYKGKGDIGVDSGKGKDDNEEKRGYMWTYYGRGIQDSSTRAQSWKHL